MVEKATRSLAVGNKVGHGVCAEEFVLRLAMRPTAKHWNVYSIWDSAVVSGSIDKTTKFHVIRIICFVERRLR